LLYNNLIYKNYTEQLAVDCIRHWQRPIYYTIVYDTSHKYIAQADIYVARTAERKYKKHKMKSKIQFGMKVWRYCV